MNRCVLVAATLVLLAGGCDATAGDPAAVPAVTPSATPAPASAPGPPPPTVPPRGPLETVTETVTETVRAAPVPTPTRFTSCAQMRRWFKYGVQEGVPEYRGDLDTDGNGWACEPTQ